ncbi:hypothetical protein CR513_13149, partial [Mucuna pruriens]
MPTSPWAYKIKRDGTPRLKGVINTILGRFVGGSSTSTKNGTCAPSTIATQLPSITFTIQDFVESNPVQNDFMVITLGIANFTMMKVLIDQGSSADFLYMSTF